jgi:hypothetical protein
MATGQTLLALASIVLLAIITMSIRNIYVQSVHNSIDTLYTTEALNFGRTLSERIQSYSSSPLMYNELDNDFSGFDDVNDAGSRIEFLAPSGNSLYATVELSAEINVLYGQTGRLATIRIFEEVNDNFILKSEYVTAIMNLFEN